MYKIHEHVIFTIFLSSIWKSLLSLWGISLSYYHRKDSIKSFLGSHQNKMKGDCKDGWTVIWHIPFSWDKAAPATISSVMLSHQYNMKTRAVVLFWIYIHISGQNKPLPVSFQRVIDNLVCHSSSLLTPTSLLLLLPCLVMTLSRLQFSLYPTAHQILSWTWQVPLLACTNSSYRNCLLRTSILHFFTISTSRRVVYLSQNTVVQVIRDNAWTQVSQAMYTEPRRWPTA